MAQRILSKPPSTTHVSADDVRRIARAACVFGYPLLLTDARRQMMTGVPRATAYQAPTNQFVHAQEFPDHSFTDVVSPNADTLYSFAWLDLSEGPVILSVPDVGARFYVMQMMDAWTNVFASPGSRTTGNGRADIGIVGPGWSGGLPRDVRQINAPTNTVWLIGRIQTNGKADYPDAHAVQQRFTLTPFRQWGKPRGIRATMPVEEGVDFRLTPPAQVARLGAIDFLGRLNQLMARNPPAESDARLMRQLASVGIAPGARLDPTDFDPDLRHALDEGLDDGRADIEANAEAGAETSQAGWSVLPANTVHFGTDYLSRATVALVAPGTNLPDDAFCPQTTTDAEGRLLSGAHRYEIRFPRERLPPVRAFWSLSMYDAHRHFAPNAFGRYALGDRDSLRFDADGSLTIYVQRERPKAELRTNWLPAPSKAFTLLMRLYWPKPEVLDETWKMPLVTRVG